MRIDNPRITGSALISSSLANEHSFMGANVGIGTTNPGAELEIKGRARNTELFVIERFNDTQNFLEFKDVSNDPTLEIFKGDGQTFLKINETGDIFSEIANAKISGSATSTGSFGILGVNRANPTAPLHIYQDNAYTAIAPTAGILIEQDGTGDAVLQFLLTGVKRWNMGIDNSDSDKFKITHGVSDLNDADVFAIDTSGNVGIGTTSPDTNLHIHKASAGSVAAYSEAVLAVENSGNTAINLLSGNGNHGQIAFGDDGDNDKGIVGYDHGADRFYVTVNGSSTKRLVVDSTGNVGVGTSSPARALHVVGDALVTGILTAQEFHTEFVSASVMFDSGSTKFGDDTADIHQMTGSLKVSGSLGINLPLSQSGAETSLDVGTLVEGGDGVNFGVVIRGQELPGTNLELADGIGLKFEIPIDTATSNIGASIETIKASNLDSNSETKMIFKTSGNDETLDTALTIASNQNVFIEAAKSLYFDGGGHTYISETSNDVLDVYVGGANALKISPTEIQVPRYITHMDDGNNYIDFETDTQTFVTDGGNTLQLLSNHDVVASQGNIIATSGNISGSSTSTGSFGQTNVGGRVLFTQTSNLSTAGSINLNTNGYLYISGGSGGLVIGDDALATAIQFNDASSMAFDIGGGTRARFDANSRISLSNNDSGTENTVFGYGAGASLASGGIKNVIIGHNAGDAINTGDFNTMIGHGVGTDLTTGERNVFLGYGTGANVTQATHNIAVGMGALGDVTNHVVGTVALGYASLAASGLTTAANYTIAIGYLAANALTTGTNSIAIGFEAQMSQTTGNRNTVIGHSAMRTADGGEDFNTVIGSEAGYYINNDASHDNVIIGKNALQGGTGTILGNVAIGSGAMEAVSNNNQTGTIAIGSDALGALTSGGENMAIGYEAMKAMTAGAANIAIGYQTMDALNHADADANIAIGNNVLGAVTTQALHSCVGIGHGALDAVNNASVAGVIAIGRDALGQLTNGTGNVAIGYEAAKTVQGGNQNTIIGYEALEDGDVSNMTMVGYQAGKSINSADAKGSVGIGLRALTNITSGQGNVAIGSGSLAVEDDGDFNTAVGTLALTKQTGVSGTVANTAVGYLAGTNITTGVRNVFIGSDVAAGTTNVDRSVAIGYAAMGNANVTADGDGTIAIGYTALLALTSGIGNTAVGYQALLAEDDGDYNTAIGYGVFEKQTGTSGTTANSGLGYRAGYYNTTGVKNTYIGYHSGFGVSGNPNSSNSALGYRSLVGITTGTVNTAMGESAGASATTASGSVFLGADAGGTVTTGNQNIAIGYDAMKGGTVTGDNNIAIGVSSGDALTSGKDNVFMGNQAGIDVNSGHSNVLVGLQAGHDITTGFHNVAIGSFALDGCTDVDYAVCIGFGAGSSINSSDSDSTVAIGNEALLSMTNGQYNTAVGYAALKLNVDGDKNTAVGYEALKTFEPSTTGFGLNTALGWTAGDAVTTGYANTFLGAEAGSTGTNDLTTGTLNTLIGQATSVSATNATNQTVIGRGATGVANNTVVLGNTSVTDVYMASDGEATLHTGEINSFFSASALDPKVVFGSGSLGTSGSRYPTTDGIKMSPVHFTGYQEVQTGTGIIVAEVPYVSGIADSRLTGTLEVNYTAQEDSNRCGYYLFRIHYTGNTNITTVTNSTTNSSMAAVKVVAGDSMAIKITPTTTGTQNVLVYYEFKGFLGTS